MEFKGHYCGIKVFVTESCGSDIPKRKNKKRRIQKKWLKRYGKVFKPSTALIIAKLYGETIIFCHPNSWDKYKKILETGENK